MVANGLEGVDPRWHDCSDLARQIRMAKRREMWIFVGVGVGFAIAGLLVLALPWLIGTSDLTIVAVALFGVGAFFAVIGGWGTVRAGYLAAVRVDDDALRFRFLGRPESATPWEGIRLELVHVSIPAFPYLRAKGADMDASWMVWLHGEYVGQVPPTLMDLITSGAAHRGVSVTETDGPFRGVPADKIVRVHTR